MPQDLNPGRSGAHCDSRRIWACLASKRGAEIARNRGVERQRSTRVVLLGVVSRTEDDHGT